MNKNTFLAIGLSMLVLLAYYAFFTPSPPTPSPTPQQQQQSPPPFASSTLSQTSESSAEPSNSLPFLTESNPSLTRSIGTPLVVETPIYRAQFDLQGGVLHSLVLKKYHADKGVTSWSKLLPFLSQWFSPKEVDEVSLVEMVDKRFPQQYPFGVLINDDKSSLTTKYKASQSRMNLQAGDSPRSLVLKTKTPSGTNIVKTFTFAPDSYIIDYQLQIRSNSTQGQQLQALSLMGTAPPSPNITRGIGNHTGPLWWVNDDLEKEDPDDLNDGLVIQKAEWGGSAGTYFINAALTEQGSQRLVFGGLKTSQKKLWQSFYGFQLPSTIVTASQPLQHRVRVYIGPKDPKSMRDFHQKFEMAKDLTLTFIAEPMLVGLRTFYSLTGNYGWAIIILTICIRLILFPLTYMGSRSMKRMRILQPKMKAIKERFKGNKERINQETFQLYRKHKINPLGGCLPILVQIPIFFAFYSALLSAIELRHQPFIFWIQDLSVKDGLYILPILMAASMVLQQKIMPAPADPTQQKILAWMPIIFLFFMFNFPSGLVLYWLVSNLLSIVQQIAVDRLTPTPA